MKTIIFTLLLILYSCQSNTVEKADKIRDNASLISKFDHYEVYQRPIYYEKRIIGWMIEYRPTGLSISEDNYFKGFRTVYIDRSLN